MSSNTEESGGTIRVTRSSLRRMASSESLNDIETVSNTPTKAPAKKLETISERANLTQPLLNSPVSRRNRKISEQNTNTSSPARCVTRRMSLEKEIQLTPIPSRPARRSLSRTIVTIDSDSDTQSLNVSDGRIKSSRKKRESTVDIINEEPENEQEVNAEMSTNQRDSSKDSDEVGESELNKSSENELELRNRSISKSPSCKLLENCRPLSVNIEKMSEINSTSVTVDEEQEKDDQVDTSAEKFPKVFSKKIRRSMDAIKETFDNVLDEMKNNFQAPTENKEKFFDCVNEVEEKSLDVEVEEKTTADVSLNTLVRGRRSIHDEAEIDMEEEEVNTMLKDFEAEIDSAFKNSPIKRFKTPKKTNSVSINDTIEISNDMEISNHEDSNMEISPNLNKTKSPRKSFEKAVNGSANKSIIQSETIVESEEVMEELPVDSSGKDVSDEEEKEEVSIKNSSTSERMSRSWSQSIKCTSEPIDKYNLNRKSEVIIKSPNQSVKYTTENKIPSSDESEDEDFEENSLIDDEAEVGSNESITNSELNYLEDNEVPDDGESLGSRDTNENEIEEEEDEENDSFLDENEVSDAYSMDSAEEMIESSPKKRRSRIIVASESDDDEKQEEEKKTSPQKNSQTPTKVTSTADDEMDENPPRSNKKEKSSNKRKRDEEKFNESIQMERKRVKMSETIIEERTSERLTVKMRESIINGTSEEFEGIAELFEEENSTQLPEKIQKSSKKHSEKNSQSQVNIESVLNKCDELMSAFNKEKKAKLALKRERKAQKLAKKQEEAKKSADDENLNSSNGENKENSVKKKKKNKAKKQKLVEDSQVNKSDHIVDAITKQQEKLERKRQRKLAKKLAKEQELLAQQQQVSSSESKGSPEKVSESKKNESEVEVKLVKKKKKNSDVPNIEPVEEPVKEKKKKTSKKQHIVVEEEKEEEKVVKKKKKTTKPSSIETDEVMETYHVPEPADVSYEEPQKKVKKTKKRKLDDSVVSDAEMEIQKTKSKKKLKVLQQIENPQNLKPQKESSKSKVTQDECFMAPLPSQKLKKIIPQQLAATKKIPKQKKLKVYQEPLVSLPRPVWTTSGVFIEEPASPYKFKTTDYIPINSQSKSSTEFGVVVFDAKKNKKHQTPLAQDFRTQMMYRDKKHRDGSKKNLQGLLGKRRAF